MDEESISMGVLRDKIYELYPEDQVIPIMQEVKELQSKDLILSFKKNTYFDEGELYWGEEE